MKSLFVLLIMALILVIYVSPVLSGGRIKAQLPAHEYGTILMEKNTAPGNIKPVVFRHWVHRSKHSCRLCHVDIGFAMTAGTTDVHEQDNRAGKYCGACHDGSEAFAIKKMNTFGVSIENCQECHSEYSLGQDPKIKDNFSKLKEKLPSGRFGNYIDWAESVRQDTTKPKDFISGVSFVRPTMKNDQGNVNLDAKLKGLPDIIFSHKDHAVWNGCELCHPDVFMVKASTTKFSMQEIFNGQYCGACHGKVAFPLKDCGRCHSQPI